MKTLFDKKTTLSAKTPQTKSSWTRSRLTRFVPNRHGDSQKKAVHSFVIPILLIAGVIMPYATIGVNYAQAATNLIPNPSAETSIIIPESWLSGGFGSNTATFTYPATGLDGNRAFRIDMTSFDDGDAKWYFADVPVTPGKTYVFSNLSQSNVPTEVDVRYRMETGNTINTEMRDQADSYQNSWNFRSMNERDQSMMSKVKKFKYVHLGVIPVQSSPKMNQFTFTVPEGAVSLTVFHELAGVGYLTTDNYSLVEAEGGVTPDTTAPVVSITAPTASSTVSGTTTPVAVNATDDVGVAGVKLLLDGTMVGAELTTTPYNFVWNTTAAMNGTHALTAVARDAAGNIATSTDVSVTVNNGTTTVDTVAPLISINAPAVGATLYGTTTVSATATDAVGVAGVIFKLDGTMIGTEITSAPYSFDWNTGSATNGTHMLTAEARDAAGNIGTSTSVSIAINNTLVADTVAPVVSISIPAAGATISGVASVSVNASDDVGVVGVKLKIDGTVVAVEDTSSPFEFSGDTTLLTNGMHAITAEARDAAGNIATSTPVSVTVSN